MYVGMGREVVEGSPGQGCERGGTGQPFLWGYFYPGTHARGGQPTLAHSLPLEIVRGRMLPGALLFLSDLNGEGKE